jgi:hypothetical protein
MKKITQDCLLKGIKKLPNTLCNKSLSHSKNGLIPIPYQEIHFLRH